jgi:serine/threonine protein kinase/Flp pilus assembly protein TadD
MNDDVTLDLDSRQPLLSDVPAARDAWGDFKLLARVGYGGFGEVYRAWDPALEREVALKLLLPSRTGTGQTDEEYKSMLREARALASVRHPNIVPVYGIDRHDGRVGFWTDFVKGKTLSSLLGSQGPFGYREAALIGLDVTRALSAVHRAGILHRDIKAENVMREEGGRILLMDFGLSTLPHRQAGTSGTPNYMAPELWRGRPASVESDIYAMGILLFHLVTNEYPAKLGGLTASEATAALARRWTLMDLRSDLPEPFLRAVGRAMEMDPAKRFNSAGQLAEALAECLGTAVPVEARTADAIRPEQARPRLPVWSRWGIAAIFVLGGASLKVPAVRRVLHLDPSPEKTAAVSDAAPSATGSHYDDYEKANALLQKSYKDSNVTDAIHIFESIPKDDPAFKLAQAGLGAAYFKQYRNSGEPALLDKATAASKAALALDSKLAPALVTMAQIEANAGHNDVAMAQVEEAIKSDPNSAEAYAAQGEVYVALGRMPDAIAAIQKAIALEPDNSMWLLRLGDDYKSIGKLEDAAATWQDAVKLDPQNIFAFYDLGIVNMRLDKLDEARQDFQKVLAAGPDEDSYRALGTVYQLEGDYANAEKMDEQAIKLDSNDFRAWMNLGNVYAWSSRHDKAMEAYNKAIELAEDRRKAAPTSTGILMALGNLYASTGDSQKSLPLVRKSLALAPDEPTVQYLAGYSYELLHQRETAIPLMAKALAHGGPNPEFQRSPELASLRNDPAFTIALEQARAESTVDKKNKLK